jgi:hypothetical protein
MDKRGAFGYIVGKKKRMMYIDEDTELMWQILVREIYILMKHYTSLENLKLAFEKIKITKNTPTSKEIEKCKLFYDYSNNTQPSDWHTVLKYCQNSYINLLEAGYINNQNDITGRIFILDLNKGSVRYYIKKEDKIIEQGATTIEAIMEFQDMPSKTYTEIVEEMKTKFSIYYKNLIRIHEEIEKLKNLKNKAKIENALNIEDKVDKLLDDMEWEKKQLHMERRVFYNRLKAIDLIEEPCETDITINEKM